MERNEGLYTFVDMTRDGVMGLYEDSCTYSNYVPPSLVLGFEEIRERNNVVVERLKEDLAGSSFGKYGGEPHRLSMKNSFGAEAKNPVRSMFKHHIYHCNVLDIDLHCQPEIITRVNTLPISLMHFQSRIHETHLLQGITSEQYLSGEFLYRLDHGHRQFAFGTALADFYYHPAGSNMVYIDQHLEGFEVLSLSGDRMNIMMALTLYLGIDLGWKVQFMFSNRWKHKGALTFVKSIHAPTLTHELVPSLRVSLYIDQFSAIIRHRTRARYENVWELALVDSMPGLLKEAFSRSYRPTHTDLVRLARVRGDIPSEQRMFDLGYIADSRDYSDLDWKHENFIRAVNFLDYCVYPEDYAKYVEEYRAAARPRFEQLQSYIQDVIHRSAVLGHDLTVQCIRDSFPDHGFANEIRNIAGDFVSKSLRPPSPKEDSDNEAPPDAPCTDDYRIRPAVGATALLQRMQQFDESGTRPANSTFNPNTINAAQVCCGTVSLVDQQGHIFGATTPATPLPATDYIINLTDQQANWAPRTEAIFHHDPEQDSDPSEGPYEKQRRYQRADRVVGMCAESGKFICQTTPIPEHSNVLQERYDQQCDTLKYSGVNFSSTDIIEGEEWSAEEWSVFSQSESRYALPVQGSSVSRWSCPREVKKQLTGQLLFEAAGDKHPLELLGQEVLGDDIMREFPSSEPHTKDHACILRSMLLQLGYSTLESQCKALGRKENAPERVQVACWSLQQFCAEIGLPFDPNHWHFAGTSDWSFSENRKFRFTRTWPSLAMVRGLYGLHILYQPFTGLLHRPPSSIDEDSD